MRLADLGKRKQQAALIRSTPNAAIRSQLPVHEASPDQAATAGLGTATQEVGTERPRDTQAVTPLVERAFAFVDLCGFTAFLDAQGVRPAQRELQTLRVQVRAVSGRRGVTVAKWLGDGAMLVGTNIGPVLAAAAELAARYEREPMAIRGGVAHGDALVFDGDDYVGLPANLAARLCQVARPGEILAVGYPAAALPSWIHVAGTRDVTLRGLGRFRRVQRLETVAELNLNVLD